MGEVIRLKNRKRFPKPKTRSTTVTDPVNQLNQTLREDKIEAFGAFTVDSKRNLSFFIGCEDHVVDADVFQALRLLKKELCAWLDEYDE